MGREDPFVPGSAASWIEVSPASGGYLPIFGHGLTSGLHAIALVGAEGASVYRPRKAVRSRL